MCTLIQKIDSKIRFTGVINSKGRLTAGGMVPSKTRLGDRKRDEMLYMELALRVKMRSEFDDDLGEVKFSMSFREKLIVMSFPMKDDVLMVSMERKTQFEQIAFSILRELFFVLSPATVYVIVAVPAATPVITPLVLTVATARSELLHVPPLTVELKVVVSPTHTACVPESVPADGGAVKLVDRLGFSHANFTIAKNWVKG